jgi:ABC-type lipopolysaccharide export system ATPase subunit
MLTTIPDRVFVHGNGKVVLTGASNTLLESIEIQEQYLGIH